MRLADAGPVELALADTIGVGVPGQVLDLFGALHQSLGALPLRAHFHNTRNTGIANAFAALQVGVETLDASIGGIGGCPFAPKATGNIGTEDLIYMLDRMQDRTRRRSRSGDRDRALARRRARQRTARDGQPRGRLPVTSHAVQAPIVLDSHRRCQAPVMTYSVSLPWMTKRRSSGRCCSARSASAIFIYGRRQRKLVPFISGIALMGVPYFIDGTGAMVAVCVAFMALPYFVQL